MAARPRLGMVRGVPPVSFRVTKADRAALEALAAAAGLTVNELARARAVAGLTPKERVTPSLGGNGHAVVARGELAVGHDEVSR